MAEKKKRSKEISQSVKDRLAPVLSASVQSTSLGDTNDERKIDDTLDEILNEVPIEDNSNMEILKENTSLDYIEKQLDEMTNKFLETSERLHILEGENSKLIAENNVLKSRCQELESIVKTLEDDLFSANMDVSEKLSKITSLEATVNSLKNGYSIQGFGKNTVKGLNGYESWN